MAVGSVNCDLRFENPEYHTFLEPTVSELFPQFRNEELGSMPAATQDFNRVQINPQ